MLKLQQQEANERYYKFDLIDQMETIKQRKAQLYLKTKKVREEYIKTFNFPSNYFETNAFAQTIPRGALQKAIDAKKRSQVQVLQ